MTSIYGAIEADHETHRRLLNEIDDTAGDIEHRKKLWAKFYNDVKSHAAAEEETFYAKLMADPSGQDDARHSVAEHKELDDIMEELNEMDLSSSGWLNRFKTLKHDYEHHMDEEEDEIFAKARKVFDGEQEQEFAKRFLKRKVAERDLVEEKAEKSMEE
jgi:hemerythrin superfamily protein